MQPRRYPTDLALLALPPLIGDRQSAQGCRQIRRERGFDHDFDPLRRLICCGQLRRPLAGSGARGNAESEGDRLDLRSALQILAFMRFWVHNMEAESEDRRAAETAAGSAPPQGARDLSDDYSDSLIDEAIQQLCECGPEGLAGCCLGCGTARPTLMIITEERGCRHLVYCDDCGRRQMFGAEPGAPSVPAHLWADASRCLVTCPMCRARGRLVRIWLPEESGGQNGLCRRCNARDATVVVMPCRHLCCCEECKDDLAAVATPGPILECSRDAPAVITCPTCSTKGPAYKVFLP